MSFVKSNSQGNVGTLLNDEKRLNVAFSRAKSKLIMVGSEKTLSSPSSEKMSTILKIAKERGWIVGVDCINK